MFTCILRTLQLPFIFLKQKRKEKERAAPKEHTLIYYIILCESLSKDLQCITRPPLFLCKCFFCTYKKIITSKNLICKKTIHTSTLIVLQKQMIVQYSLIKASKVYDIQTYTIKYKKG